MGAAGLKETRPHGELGLSYKSLEMFYLHAANLNDEIRVLQLV